MSNQNTKLNNIDTIINEITKYDDQNQNQNQNNVLSQSYLTQNPRLNKKNNDLNSNYYNLGNLSINEIYINLFKKLSDNTDLIMIGYNLVQYNDNNIDNYTKINKIINLNISLLEPELRKYKIDNNNNFIYNKVKHRTLIECPSINISMLFKYHIIKQLINNNKLNHTDIIISQQFINCVDNIVNNSPLNLSVDNYNLINSYINDLSININSLPTDNIIIYHIKYIKEINYRKLIIVN
jgi:hypothetical protein